MKKQSLSLWVAGLLCLGAAAPASAGMVKPAIVGGINEMINTGAGLGYTAGLDVAFWLGPTMDFTVGGEFLSRGFTGVSNINYVHVPGIFNFHLGPVFSLGAGGFYDFGLSTGAGSNYGVSGSLRLKPAMMPLFLEGRFNYGLNTKDFSEATKEVEVLIGFVF